jgi:pimeloyl-ACP methyl ester carboxylesterase
MPDAGCSQPERLDVSAEARSHFFSLFVRRPPRHAAREAERAFMETGERLHVPLWNSHLEVRSWGAGPAVLLVHGLHLSGGTFRFMIPALVDAGLRAVALDAPAHGASDGHFVDESCIAHAILVVARRLGALAGIVAHSMGVVWSLRALDAGMPAPRAAWIGSPVVLHGSIDLYVARYGVSLPVQCELRRLAHAFSVGSPSVREMASRSRAATLVVHDRDDPRAPFEGAEELARSRPGSRTLFTSRLGHYKTLASSLVISAVVEHLHAARSTVSFEPDVQTSRA